eukprot:CAMPEP_0169429038 /NCGR_PEP_ID=MMETSP1042-20121227/1651_1 /TAXON_ID=464988 /ORGANISM="Hemiselmis andersenii, Strain CCMP1180" /LENGTH=124 /DNA_ID=CAMNT_0009539257 /DNA_START=1733 /DNA_END=2107 /DNA_ORIENTATION=+
MPQKELEDAKERPRWHAPPQTINAREADLARGEVCSGLPYGASCAHEVKAAHATLRVPLRPNDVALGVHRHNRRGVKECVGEGFLSLEVDDSLMRVKLRQWHKVTKLVIQRLRICLQHACAVQV